MDIQELKTQGRELGYKVVMKDGELKVTPLAKASYTPLLYPGGRGPWTVRNVLSFVDFKLDERTREQAEAGLERGRMMASLLNEFEGKTHVRW